MSNLNENHNLDSAIADAAASDLSSVSGPFRVVKVRAFGHYVTVSEHETFKAAHAAFADLVVACDFPTYYTDADGEQICVMPINR